MHFLIAAIHLVAAIAFLLVLNHALTGMLLILALGVSVALSITRDRSRSNRVLVLGDGGVLDVRSSAGTVSVRVLPGSADFGWAIWLQWREIEAEGNGVHGSSDAMMLLPDCVSGDDWRHLRIWLRHCSGARFSGDAA